VVSWTRSATLTRFGAPVVQVWSGKWTVRPILAGLESWKARKWASQHTRVTVLLFLSRTTGWPQSKPSWAVTLRVALVEATLCRRPPWSPQPALICARPTGLLCSAPAAASEPCGRADWFPKWVIPLVVSVSLCSSLLPYCPTTPIAFSFHDFIWVFLVVALIAISCLVTPLGQPASRTTWNHWLCNNKYMLYSLF
jgi:hypothetical protein